MKKTLFFILMGLLIMISGNIFSQEEYEWEILPETYYLESYSPQSAIYFDISSMLVNANVPGELEYIDVDKTQAGIQSYRVMQLEGTFYALDNHMIKFVPFSPYNWIIPDDLWISAFDENWVESRNDAKMTFVIENPN